MTEPDNMWRSSTYTRRPYLVVFLLVVTVVFLVRLGVRTNCPTVCEEKALVNKERDSTIDTLEDNRNQLPKPEDVGSVDEAHALGKAIENLKPREEGRHRDLLDESEASFYLEKLKKYFSYEGDVPYPADPNNPSTIKTWWQAAAMIDWYIHSPPRFKCRRQVPYGNWHVCQDRRVEIKPPCLVYSIGIDWDFSFDDAMGALGCEVHSFDPSMRKESHRRSDNVTFHNVGLGDVNTNSYVPRIDRYVRFNQVWKMRTVEGIREMLGHQHRTIDVFKMDVEGYEWRVLKNMIEMNSFDNIRQFLMEFHIFPIYPLKKDFIHLYHIHRRLREDGLREFSFNPREEKLHFAKFNIQGDVGFVNARYLRSNGQVDL